MSEVWTTGDAPAYDPWDSTPDVPEPKFHIGQIVRREGQSGEWVITDIRRFDNYQKERKCWYYYEASRTDKRITADLDYESCFHPIDNGVSEMIDEELDKLFDDI